ncbi:hypothetical protein K3888_05880 [Dietzia aurantiaca]|uniref:hypothetical protein n=1 Tax=Dietzia aurantiaca TaxID=983873 RepID=UPI001E5508E2|nr:hypothetical protein [Dietzia aurantiaca]MCD2262228.1 hypothetical protein [Dietzia aurantiaca]
MSPFRPFIDLLAQLWFALDTASAVRHGKPVSDRARAYCMTDHAPTRAHLSSVAA